MKYLPFENFEIHTKLSSDEVFYRLRAATDKERDWWILANKPYWGKVNRHNFIIRRYRGWWRNFILVILGEIQPGDLGCCLRIRIRLFWLNYLIDILMFGFVWLSFFMGHANLILQKIQTGTWQFASPGEWLLSEVMYIVFIGLFYIMFVGSFKYEVLHVKSHLLRLTETAEEDIIYRDTILGVTESQIIKALFIIPVVVSLGWIIYKFLF